MNNINGGNEESAWKSGVGKKGKEGGHFGSAKRLFDSVGCP